MLAVMARMNPPERPRRAAAFRPVPCDAAAAALGDHRRYPLCRVLVACSLCGWARDYSPEAIIARLRKLRAGGEATPVGEVARRVAWPCPMCHRVNWRADFAWPPDADPRDIRRLTAQIRN